MATTAKKRKGGALVRQALAETRLKFGGEERFLAEQAAQNRGNYRVGVRNERAAAAGLMAALSQGDAETRGAYSRASQAAAGSSAKALADLAGLGAAADPYRAVATGESTAGEQRVALAGARAVEENAARRSAAAAGRIYGVNRRTAEYQQEQGKVLRQQGQLKAEEGLYASTTYRDLVGAKRQLRMEQRKIDLELARVRDQQRSTEATITGVDPVTGMPTAAERDRRADNQRADRNGGRGGPSRGAITRHQGIVGDVQGALQLARRLKAQHPTATWNDVLESLTLPQKPSPSGKWDDDPKKNTYQPANPYGGHDALKARAAVQLAAHGALTAGMTRALKAQGLLPGRIPNAWRPARPGASPMAHPTPFGGHRTN